MKAVFLGLALLAMTRCARLPVSLGGTGAILLVLFVAAVCRVKNRRYVASGLVIEGVGFVGCGAIAAPQASPMWQHTKLVPNDSGFCGVGDEQLLWSLQIGKFAGVVINCPGTTWAGVVYAVPFADATNTIGERS